MNQEPERFPGRQLLYAIKGREVYHIKGSDALPPKFSWLENLGDYFLYATEADAVTAIATRQADGTLDGELIGRKGIRFVAKDFSDVIRQVELIDNGLFSD